MSQIIIKTLVRKQEVYAFFGFDSRNHHIVPGQMDLWVQSLQNDLLEEITSKDNAWANVSNSNAYFREHLNMGMAERYTVLVKYWNRSIY